ncbi:MAG: flagellar export chaperone FliS [bacterium]
MKYDPFATYNQVQIETADQQKLILLAYDAAARFCQQAIDSISNGDVNRKGFAIQKAYDTISELHRSLDLEKGQDVARNLSKLYEFLGRQLTIANLNNDAEVLRSVVTVLNDLRSTWVQVFEKETALAE